MDNHLITGHVERIAGQVAMEAGIEVVHVDLAGTKRDLVVRIYIDKEGGVTLDDCSRISREIESILDVEDLIPSRYVLEVSSPGIERELYSLDDFKKFGGRLVKLKTRTEHDGQKTFVGTITGVDSERVNFDERTKGNMSFDYSDIVKANLKIDLSREFGRSKG